MNPNLAILIGLIVFTILILFTGHIYLNREALMDLVANSPEICYRCRVGRVNHALHETDVDDPHQFVSARLVFIPEDDLR